jgi:hypothetical protein
MNNSHAGGLPQWSIIPSLLAIGAFVLAVLFLLLYVIVYAPINRLTAVNDVTITITDRERVVSGESSYYLVFTNEGEFEVTDTMFFWDFASSSRYNQLKPGLTCQVKTSGTRWAFMSRYPNIVEIYGCEGAGDGATEVAADILRRIQAGEIQSPEAFAAVLRSNAQALGFSTPRSAD